MWWRRQLYFLLWKHFRVRLRPINATDYTRYWRRWNVFTKPRLFLALSAGFSFRNTGVKDEELVNSFDGSQDCSSPNDCKKANIWEKVAEESDYVVFRRKLEGHPGIYQWYCAGTYKDITPRNFVNAQNDVTFRRQWDANVMELEIVESDDATDSQVVRWVSKFPYPMKPRIYVFVRRQHVDEESKRIVVLSQALSAKEYPESSDHVRVTTYRSRLMVHAHTDFEEDGFDYILEYYDDPQSSIPTPAYNWIIQYGGPHYLKRVHEAAKKLEAMTAKEVKKSTTTMAASSVTTEETAEEPVSTDNASNSQESSGNVQRYEDSTTSDISNVAQSLGYSQSQ